VFNNLENLNSLRYCFVFVKTVRILQAANKSVGFPLLVVAATVSPFQGLPNLLVYVYPNFLTERRLHPNGNVAVWLQRALMR
jgi:hypothetical protein